MAAKSDGGEPVRLGTDVRGQSVDTPVPHDVRICIRMFKGSKGCKEVAGSQERVDCSRSLANWGSGLQISQLARRVRGFRSLLDHQF